MEDFSQVTRIDPQEADVYLARARLLLKLKTYSNQVLADINHFLEFYPSHPQAYFLRGICLSRQEDYYQAIQDFSRALEFKSDFPMAYYYRGIARIKQGEYAETIEDFTAVLNLEPEFYPALLGRGIVYYQKKDYELAKEDLDRAIKLNPRFYKAYGFRAMVYRALGKEEEAEKDWEEFFKGNIIDSLAENLEEEANDLFSWGEKMLLWGENEELKEEGMVAGVGFEPTTSGL